MSKRAQRRKSAPPAKARHKWVTKRCRGTESARHQCEKCHQIRITYGLWYTFTMYTFPGQRDETSKIRPCVRNSTERDIQDYISRELPAT